MNSCPSCDEPILGRPRACPHCSEALDEPDDRDDLVASLAHVTPDPAFAAQVRDWPDESLVRALREHAAEYEPPRRRALLDEVRRRSLPLAPTGSRDGSDTPTDRLVAVVGWIATLLGLIGLITAAGVFG